MRIGFSRTPSSGLLEGTDAEFLQLLEWSEAAPKKLIKAAKRGDVTRFVLASRTWLEPFAERFRKHVPGRLLSILPGPCGQSSIGSLIAEYSQAADKKLRFGLGRAIVGWTGSVGAKGIGSAADRLVVLELLLNPPIDLEIQTWCRLWRLALIAEPPEANPIAAAECSVVAGLVFGTLLNADSAFSQSAELLGKQLLESTDNDGTPHAAGFTNAGVWLAPFVRAGWWGKSFRQPVYSEDAAPRFRELTALATECVRGDGSFAFDEHIGLARTLLPLAARVADWPKRSPVGRAARFLSTGSKSGKRKKARKTKLPSSQSDWAQTAHLRSSRALCADLFAIAYDKATPAMEFCCRGVPLLQGALQSAVRVSGKNVPLTGDWSCTCWYSDKDGDYIELEQSGKGVKLARQVYMSRGDNFLILTDTVRAADGRAIQLQAEIPLAHGVMARADFISREWRLHSGQMPVRAFPVSLEHDRIQSSAGACEVSDGKLLLTAEGQTTATTSLVLDWHPDRTDLNAEWTSLTVTENRAIVSPAEAAAFRLRIGEHQLVGYRNTGSSTELRAVLGQHTGCETLLGLLNSNGNFEPLVLVHGDSD